MEWGALLPSALETSEFPFAGRRVMTGSKRRGGRVTD
jgi:hypothetical protein